MPHYGHNVGTKRRTSLQIKTFANEEDLPIDAFGVFSFKLSELVCIFHTSFVL